jgi:hypothetical protein
MLIFKYENYNNKIKGPQKTRETIRLKIVLVILGLDYE